MTGGTAAGLALALVQSVGAGGVGILAFASSRGTGRSLSRRESSGVVLAALGLLALAASLAARDDGGRSGSTAAILLLLARPDHRATGDQRR